MSVLNLHELMRQEAFTIHSGDADLEDWLTSSGATATLRGSHIQVDTGIGTDKIRWRKEEPERTLYRHDSWGGDEQTFRISHTISAFVCCTTRQNATATSFIGIGLGAPNNNPSYPFETTPSHPVLQLRLRLDNMGWELMSAHGGGDGDAPEAEVVALSGVTSGVQGKGSHIRLDWDAVNLEAHAYVDGILGASITDSALLPFIPEESIGVTVGHIGPNYFFTSGTHASGRTVGQIGPILVTRPGHLTVGSSS